MGRVRAAEPQTVQTFSQSVTHPVGYKFLLSLPTHYDAKSGQRWPLLLFLHGSGERGDDVWSIARHGPPKLLHAETPTAARTQLLENFIVVSPQCPKGQWWESESLLALVDHLEATYLVDRRRVYVTGLSMGGMGTWDLAIRYPERFAAIAPISGGGTFPVLYHATTSYRNALRTLAVWAFHGAKDPTVPVGETERSVQMLRAARVPEVQLTVYPEATHDAWTETYMNPELYAWLLRHERPAK